MMRCSPVGPSPQRLHDSACRRAKPDACSDKLHGNSPRSRPTCVALHVLVPGAVHQAIHVAVMEHKRSLWVKPLHYDKQS